MITVCMITKNENSNLEKCLSKLKKQGFRLLVVDTGSTDGSLETARKYTDEVYEFPWINDFSAARNFSREKAQGNIVLVVDTDEFLQIASADDITLKRQLMELEKLAKAHLGEVGLIKRINQFHYQTEEREFTDWVPRLFDRRKFHYEGSIHEQVVPLDKAMEHISYYRTDLTFLHGGYDLSEEDRERKSERNITLLKEETERFLAEHEGEDLEKLPWKEQNRAGYLMYQMGKSYYLRRDYTQAAEYFGLGLSFDLNPEIDYVADMVTSYGYALVNSGQAEKALSLTGVEDTFGNTPEFLFVLGLIYMNNAAFDTAVEKFEQATRFSEAEVAGSNSFLAWYNAGVIRECQGRVDEAKRYYEKCGDYERAKERLAAL